MFEKLKKRWNVTSNLQVTKILIVFALTGSSSAKLTGPLLKLVPVIAALEPLYFNVLYVIATLVLYQFILLFIGWVFGEKDFFIASRATNKCFFKSKQKGIVLYNFLQNQSNPKRADTQCHDESSGQFFRRG